jgi:hypothetical protein
MVSHVRLLVALGLLAAPGLSAHADGDIVWDHRSTQGAVVLTANPLGTASRTAFYTARGFTAAAIRPYAQACGFSFGMQNGGRSTLYSRLADWHAVGADGMRRSLRLPQSWDAAWEKADVPQAARIAFRWAQFQAENTFEPGDWIMGMATLDAPPSGPFRIVARYLDEKGSHEIVLDKLACAND